MSDRLPTAELAENPSCNLEEWEALLEQTGRDLRASLDAWRAQQNAHGCQKRNYVWKKDLFAP
jgi:hypothetical protein